MTYSRALHIQRLATELPIESIVLETDAPDMNPSWLAKDMDNHPNQLPQIAAFFAQLRNIFIRKISVADETKSSRGDASDRNLLMKVGNQEYQTIWMDQEAKKSMFY